VKEAVVVGAVRTPVGRYGGVLKDVRADDLAAPCIAEIVQRNRLDSFGTEDVMMGSSHQAGEDSRNDGWMAVLLAGFPVEVAWQTINRLCGSTLNAINSAAQAIKVVEGDEAWRLRYACHHVHWCRTLAFSSLTPKIRAFIIAGPKKYALHVGVQSIQPIIAGTQIGLVIQGKDS
jgi:hypothetical protein